MSNKRAGDSGLSGALKQYGSHGDDPEFDDWGPVIQSREVKENGKVIGHIEDRFNYIDDDVYTPATKQGLVDLMKSAWPEDEDSIDPDTFMFLQYADGTRRTVALDTPQDVFKNGRIKPFSTKGLIGAYYSDASQTAVWGRERLSDGRDVPMSTTIFTHSEGDEREITNTHHTVGTTHYYRERVYIPHNEHGLPIKRETRVIRKSKPKKYSV